MADPFRRRDHGPLNPIQAPTPPSRSPSPTKHSSRPVSVSLFGSISSSNLANAAQSSSPLQRRGTHRSAASMSSISLAGLSLSGVPSSPSTSGPGMVHSPTKDSFSPTIGTPGTPTNGWGGFSSSVGGGAVGGPSAAQRARQVGAEHEAVQERVFTKWLNARLTIPPHNYPPLEDLARDFMDGTRLIQLVEVLTSSPLGRHNTHPTMHRVQRFENAKLALDRIKELGVHLTNIGAEDIVDGNRKLILGMIWSLVLRFSIAEIEEEGTHAREGLLLWCQRKTRPYAEDGVAVQDFSRSWQDGLAFCALIHRHRPDLLDWDSLDRAPQAAEERLKLAFRIADEELGLPRLLDVEDLLGGRKPDERSVMTYVAQYFHAFSSTAQAETESKVISNFVENMSSLMVGLHDYESRAAQLLSSVTSLIAEWRQTSSLSSLPYDSLLVARKDVEAYRLADKVEWSKERQDLEELLLNIQTKLKTYGLRGYEPEEAFSAATLENSWTELLDAEQVRTKSINGAIRQIQDASRRRVAEIANPLQVQIADAGWELASLGSSSAFLEAQLTSLASMSASMPSLHSALKPLEAAERAWLECEAEWNDYTVHSYEELQKEVQALEQRISKRRLFIEGQIMARKATTLPPQQLEEFDSAFRSFDRSNLGRLDLDQLVGALGSLGVAEINLDEIQAQVGEEVSYEEFIHFMTDRSEMRPTSDKVRSCFRSAAGGKAYVTELDLRRLDLPTAAVAFLLDKIDIYEPPEGEEGETAADGPLLDYEEFLQRFLE